jgi:hypothetical protein
MATSEDDFGQIFFVDFIESVPHLYYIAASFGEFLSKLRVWEESSA